MEITRETIDHLAELSNFSLSDAEKSALQVDLKNIVNYISELQNLNTEGIEPTFQAFELENIWRADEIESQSATREELLNLTLNEQSHEVKVPKVL